MKIKKCWCDWLRRLDLN